MLTSLPLPPLPPVVVMAPVLMSPLLAFSSMLPILPLSLVAAELPVLALRAPVARLPLLAVMTMLPALPPAPDEALPPLAVMVPAPLTLAPLMVMVPP